MILAKRTFDVSKYKLTIPDPKVKAEGGKAAQVALVSFTVVKYDGNEELLALDRAALAMPSGRPPSGPMIKEHETAQAILELNGEEVPRPYLNMRDWAPEPRQLVMIAADRMNSLNGSTLQDFITAEFGE